MPQFSVNNLHNIELDHSEYTAITDHFPNNRCTYKNFFLKLKETFTNNNDFLLISNESKWKYQITLCMKENVTSYGIYKTGTTSNEIFRILPPREKKFWICAWTIYIMHPAHDNRGKTSFVMRFFLTFFVLFLY